MSENISLASVEQAISFHASARPSAVALVVGTERLDYGQLDRAVGRCCHSYGNLKGLLVPFRAECSVDTVVRYFAIHRAGGVAVPLEKDMPAHSFAQMQASLVASRCPEGTADVLFTTGTTGCPKGVMVSHEAMLANADNLVETQGYQPELTFIVTGPLNHVGSLSKVYTTLFSGGTVCLLDGMKDMSALFSAVAESRGKVATFLVPSSIRMLMAFAEASLRKYEARFEFVETGASPLMQSDMERFCTLLPHARLYNTYASTETGIIATYDYNGGLRLSGCLGKPMKHSEIVIDSLGRVVCQGHTLMTGYWNNPEQTAAVFAGDGLVTNDLGFIDSMGMLHLLGRNDDMINVGGYKVAPVEVENLALDSGMVEDCICIPHHHPLVGTSLQLLVVPKGLDFSKQVLYSWLQSRLEGYKLPQVIQMVDTIARNSNGKLDRKHYLSSNEDK